jgi:hypothetical protein
MFTSPKFQQALKYQECLNLKEEEKKQSSSKIVLGSQWVYHKKLDSDSCKGRYC